MARATIDRFEGEHAILLLDGREEVRPRASLPPDAREGDVIDLDSLEVDRSATEVLRERVRDVRRRAFAGRKLPPGEL